MTTPDATDSELLRRFASDRDPEAFAGLVSHHYGLVTGIGRRVLGDAHEAEDIAQATFVLLAEKAPGLVKKSNTELARWIVGAAFHLAKNRRRVLENRERREREYARQQMSESDADTAETVAIVDEAISELPRSLRDAIIARYLQGLSYRETAFELKVSADTVRGRLARAKGLLKERLTKQGVAVSGTAIAAVLTSIHDAGATPPNGFAARALSSAKPAALSVLSGGLLLKIAGVIVGIAALGWLFVSPSSLVQKTAITGETSQRASALSLSSAPPLDITPQSPAEEWEALIADRVTGPLAFERRDVADEDNGFSALLRLEKAYNEFLAALDEGQFELIKNLADGTAPWDPELVAATLIAAAPVLALYEEVLAAPDFQFPEADFDSSASYLSPILSISRVLRKLDAEERFRSGDTMGALGSTLEDIEFGLILRKGQGAMIHGLIAMNVTSGARNSLLNFLSQSGNSLTSGQLETVAARVQNFSPQNQDIEDAFGHEYLASLRFVGKFLSGRTEIDIDRIVRRERPS